MTEKSTKRKGEAHPVLKYLLSEATFFLNEKNSQHILLEELTAN